MPIQIVVKGNATRTDVERGNWVGDPTNPTLDSMPKSYCRTCEKFLDDYPALVEGDDRGKADIRYGDVGVLERMLECREIAPGLPPVHRWQPGQLLHEEAVRRGYGTNTRPIPRDADLDDTARKILEHV